MMCLISTKYSWLAQQGEHKMILRPAITDYYDFLKLSSANV